MAADLGLGLHQVGDAIQHLLKNAARFASLDQPHGEGGKHLGDLHQRAGKLFPCTEPGRDLADADGKLLIGHVVGQQLQPLGQRQAALQDHGQLPEKHQQIFTGNLELFG